MTDEIKTTTVAELGPFRYRPACSAPACNQHGPLQDCSRLERRHKPRVEELRAARAKITANRS